MSETVAQYLWRCVRRDRHKCEPCIAGWRNTREVAEYFGWSMATARRRLEEAFERDEIECVGPAPFEWFARALPANDDDGEPIPMGIAA